MIVTKETQIDLGGRLISLNLVANNEEILMANIEAEETPVWVELWPAAIGLARWLWQKGPLPNHQVLELGAGLGLPGIVAAMQQATVLQTDYIPEAMEIARKTAVENQVTGIHQQVADWRNFDIQATFDLIIGSDITYHPDLNPYLEQIFGHNLAPHGQVIIADSGRLESEKFLNHLLAKDWQAQIDQVPVELDGFSYQVKIYQLTRKA